MDLDTRPVKQGAVLLLIYARDGEPHIVFTKRTNNVAEHKGEVSFPGGSYEVEDGSLMDTALRETREELGIEIDRAAVLTRLDDARTATSGFIIAPFVVYVDRVPVFQPDPFEVAEVFDVPLKNLLDPSVVHEEQREYDGVPQTVHFYRHQNHEIWGATAKILKQFLELYRAKKIELPIEDTVGTA